MIIMDGYLSLNVNRDTNYGKPCRKEIFIVFKLDILYVPACFGDNHFCIKFVKLLPEVQILQFDGAGD